MEVILAFCIAKVLSEVVWELLSVQAYDRSRKYLDEFKVAMIRQIISSGRSQGRPTPSPLDRVSVLPSLEFRPLDSAVLG